MKPTFCYKCISIFVHCRTQWTFSNLLFSPYKTKEVMIAVCRKNKKPIYFQHTSVISSDKGSHTLFLSVLLCKPKAPFLLMRLWISIFFFWIYEGEWKFARPGQSTGSCAEHATATTAKMDQEMLWDCLQKQLPGHVLLQPTKESDCFERRWEILTSLQVL